MSDLRKFGFTRAPPQKRRAVETTSDQPEAPEPPSDSAAGPSTESVSNMTTSRISDLDDPTESADEGEDE